MPHPSNTIYDEVNYPSFPIVYTHPDRLATVATLFGMKPAPASRCRYLEVGCFDGVNLASMAITLPGSQFTGVDLAGTAIARGQSMLNDVGIQNVKLVHADLMEMAPDFGDFDYIVVHGLFTWVPEPVCDHILSICKHSLAPQGVAYISYNTLPGCHSRLMLREMVQFHNRDFDDPQQKMTQALTLLKLLSNAKARDPDLYTQTVRDEYKRWSARAPEAFYHDELGDVFRPLYFHQFMEQAVRHELQFLSEADLFDMVPHGFSPNAVEVLDRIKNDIVLREQYMDFMRGRFFRKTLLCHPEVGLNRTLDSARVRDFCISTVANPSTPEPNYDRDIKETFESEQGGKVVSADPLARALFWRLIQSVPEQVPFAQLAVEVEQLARERYGYQPEAGEDVVRDIADFAWSTYCAGLLNLHLTPSPFALHAGEAPKVSSLAQWQARRSEVVSTLHHRTLKLSNAVQRGILALCDGTRERQKLRDDVVQVFASGALDLLGEDGQPIRDVSLIIRVVDTEFDQFLAKAARAGVFLP